MRVIPKLAFQLKVAQVIASQMLGESVGALKTAVLTNLRQTSCVGLQTLRKNTTTSIGI